MEELKFYETPEGHKIVDPRYWPSKLKEYLKLEEEFLIKNINKCTTLLDIGFGEGRHLTLLSNKCSKLFGVDYSKTMVEYSRKVLKDLKNIFLFYDDIKDIEFPPDSFDYIICMFNTFGNMSEETQNELFKKIDRLLKPQGKFILSVYSEKAKDTQIEFYNKIGLEIKNCDEDFVYTNKFISERFSKEKIQRILLNNTNLKIKNIVSLNEISYIVEIEKID